MKKQIPKPSNWKDFEDVCTELWGNIWKIPHEIAQNGRDGQAQQESREMLRDLFLNSLLFKE